MTNCWEVNNVNVTKTSLKCGSYFKSGCLPAGLLDRDFQSQIQGYLHMGKFGNNERIFPITR